MIIVLATVVVAARAVTGVGALAWRGSTLAGVLASGWDLWFVLGAVLFGAALRTRPRPLQVAGGGQRVLTVDLIDTIPRAARRFARLEVRTSGGPVNGRPIGTGIGIADTLVAAAAFSFAGLAVLRQDRLRWRETVFTGKLPVLDGQRLAATVLEVTYPPGGANPAHRHPCPVIGYVLAGAVRMQLKGQSEKIFGAGETFFESPADVHAVSANASQSEPARFLAHFVRDREAPLSVPVNDTQIKP